MVRAGSYTASAPDQGLAREDGHLTGPSNQGLAGWMAGGREGEARETRGSQGFGPLLLPGHGAGGWIEEGLANMPPSRAILLQDCVTNTTGDYSLYTHALVGQPSLPAIMTHLSGQRSE